MVAAVVTHDTSRALDPQLHTHVCVMNVTFDAVENRWKALEPYEMLQAKKFTENVYYHELVRSLTRFGYQVQSKPRPRSQSVSYVTLRQREQFVGPDSVSGANSLGS